MKSSLPDLNGSIQTKNYKCCDIIILLPNEFVSHGMCKFCGGVPIDKNINAKYCFIQPKRGKAPK